VRILIIGNSAAAVGAVEAIRQHDQTVEIVIVSDEPHMIYSRPLLSHYFAGEIDRLRLAYRGSDFYTRYAVTPMLSTHVVHVDSAAHCVLTEQGDCIPYDRLLIATGGRPIVPPVPGMDSKGVFTFTRCDDVEAILAYLESYQVKHVVVVGGGMIGIKVTDAVLKRGLKVSMVELAPRILSAAFDTTASRIMTQLLREAGVDVLTENTVDHIYSAKDGHVVGVELRDGRQLVCEMVIFGIGVRPNTEIVADTPIQINRGIVVDAHMRTNVPDIYAAGDVAEAYDIVVDMNRTVAIWPNAYRQGAIAGAHMVGIECADRGGVAMNAIEVAGVPAVAIGSSNLEDDEHEYLVDLDEAENRYKRLVLEGNRLVGAILVGDIDRAGIYTGLIRNRIDISDCKRNLLSTHFGLLSLPDQYRKHVVTGMGIEV